MTRGPGPAAPLHPQWSTATDRDSVGTLHRHPDIADGARPKHANKYGLLAPAETVGDPDVAGTQVRVDDHGAIMGVKD